MADESLTHKFHPAHGLHRHTPAQASTTAMEQLLDHAQAAVDALDAPADGSLPPGATQFALEELTGEVVATEPIVPDQGHAIDLELEVEIGRTMLAIPDAEKLRPGAVVGLDKPTDAPVDVLVNGHRIARGELVVLNGAFCIRVTELAAAAADLS